MMSKVCMFALLASQALATSRFFVGSFESSYNWAYPIDICAPSGVLGYPYVMYTCGADYLWVTETYYSSSDSTCTGSQLSAYNYTSIDWEVSGLYQFNCDGTNDYIESLLDVNSCTSPIATSTVYSAINTCFKYTNTNFSYDVYEETQCNSSAATIDVYAAVVQTCNVDTGYASLQGQSWISTSCGLYLTSPAKVYATLLDCVYDDYTNFAQQWDNSADYDLTTEDVEEEVWITYEVSAASELSTDPDLCGFSWWGLFVSYFNGSMVNLTQTCNSYEGASYPSISISVDIMVFDSALSSGWTPDDDCVGFLLGLDTIVAASLSNYDLVSNCTLVFENLGHMASLNYLIVFAIAFIAMMM